MMPDFLIILKDNIKSRNAGVPDMSIVQNDMFHLLASAHASQMLKLKTINHF